MRRASQRFALSFRREGRAGDESAARTSSERTVTRHAEEGFVFVAHNIGKESVTNGSQGSRPVEEKRRQSGSREVSNRHFLARIQKYEP